MKAFILSLWALSAFAGEMPPVIVPQSSLMKVAATALEENEVVVVDRLIQATQDLLKLQQHLKELMISFHNQKEAFVQGDQTKKHVSVMVQTAREILEIITVQHWQFQFSQEYLDELTLFSSIAGKNGIKRP